MEAKISPETALGRLCVMEMGRCCEKKLERARLSKGTCCVLGTLGSFLLAEACGSLALFLRFSLEDFADRLAEAGTDCPAGRSFGPLSGLDGFEEEHRLWWRLGLPERG